MIRESGDRDDLELKYTGKDLDEDTGLYYFNARWYDADTGRFISQDPARDGANWYVYVTNNPLKYRDPTGLSKEDRQKRRAERRERRAKRKADRKHYRDRIKNASSHTERSLIRAERAAQFGAEARTAFGRSHYSAAEKAHYRGAVDAYDREKGRLAGTDVELGLYHRGMNLAMKEQGAEEVTLSSLINTDNLAQLLQNPDALALLGDDTKAYVSGMSLEQLQEQLGRMTVLTGADGGIFQNTLQSFGLPSYTNTPDMGSIGNNIYSFGGLGSTMDASMAALLGHETIHSMQFGYQAGYSGMVSGYKNNMVGLETEAYEFGGRSRQLTRLTQRFRSGKVPYLRDPAHGDWFR